MTWFGFDVKTRRDRTMSLSESIRIFIYFDSSFLALAIRRCSHLDLLFFSLVYLIETRNANVNGQTTTEKEKVYFAYFIIYLFVGDAADDDRRKLKIWYWERLQRKEKMKRLRYSLSLFSASSPFHCQNEEKGAKLVCWHISFIFCGLHVISWMWNEKESTWAKKPKSYLTEWTL